jgi:hypothetical protein
MQFSVKHEQQIDCGGGYIKLIPSTVRCGSLAASAVLDPARRSRASNCSISHFQMSCLHTVFLLLYWARSLLCCVRAEQTPRGGPKEPATTGPHAYHEQRLDINLMRAEPRAGCVKTAPKRAAPLYSDHAACAQLLSDPLILVQIVHRHDACNR